MTLMLNKKNIYVDLLLKKNKDFYFAIKELCNKNFENYIKWHQKKIKCSLDESLNMANYYYETFLKIKSFGYDVNEFKNFTIKENRFWQNITINILTNGELQFFDGTHRACILFNLNKNVLAEIQYVNNSFDSINLETTYQKTIHPLFENIIPIRKNLNRYHCIKKIIDLLDIKNTCEIGCAEGSGLFEISNNENYTYGTEINYERYKLAKSLCEFKKIKIKNTNEVLKNFECYVALSVLHHVMDSNDSFNKTIGTLSKSKFLFVELPEKKSKTWHNNFLTMENPSEIILNEINKFFKHKYLVYVDDSYANRETWFFSKESINDKILNEVVLFR